ncbi:MAG: ABC transporter ATP-binding protein [Patescibacteria group bacterium]
MGKQNKANSVIQIFRPYLGIFSVAFVIIVLANGLNLALPRLIGYYIDAFQNNQELLKGQDYWLLALLVVGLFVLATLQTVITVFLSERIARDLRSKMITKISKSSFSLVNNLGVSELITTFSSDVKNVKSIASQGMVYFLTAVLLLIGSCVMLLITNWYLALIAISILPIVIVLFVFIFSKISPLFSESQLNLSKINQVVNESIFGSSLVRILNSQSWEEKKFAKVNQTAKDISIKVVTLFSLLIPSINLVSNLAVVVILFVGGRQIVDSSLTLGGFASFITYYNLLITPIFILGFTSQGFSRGFVSYARIEKILDSPDEKLYGNYQAQVKGVIEVKDVNLEMGGVQVLKGVSFKIQPGTRTAILGPTGAGKSQLFNLMIGLSDPTSGQILVDDVVLNNWDKENLLSQLGLVFQDSLVFRGSLKENIVFSNLVSEENLNNAIYTSKLDEFVTSLESGLETQVSERGATLSGGQKQRLMLARSLAQQPKILLLDDFTARVDNQTEQEIWDRLKYNFPEITLVSITQKIEAVKDFEQIIVLMQGELVGVGTHQSLLESNREYQQIYSSQQTIEN